MQQTAAKELGIWRLAVASAALAFWIGYCLWQHPVHIEAALQNAATESLKNAGFPDLQARVSGREALLSGSVDTPEQRAQALLALDEIDGMLDVRDELQVVPAAVELPPPHLVIRTHANGITLLGPLPSTERRDLLMGAARELFGSERVEDRLMLDSTFEEGPGLANAVKLLEVLAAISHPLEARIEANSVRLSGSVATAEERDRVESAAQNASNGVRLFFSAIQVAPIEPASPAGVD